MDPVYLMVYLMIGMIAVICALIAVMGYMLMTLKGIHSETRKHSRLFVRLSRHLATSFRVGSVPPPPADGPSTDNLPLRSTIPPPLTSGTDYALEATSPVSRVRRKE